MSFLVVDCGTSACKAAVVSADGRILSWSRRPTRVLRPAPRHAEIDPDELWKKLVSAARAALRAAPAADRRIEAIGVSALLGYVFLGKSGRPLGPAVIWMDNRAGAEAEEIRRRIPEAELYARTGRRASAELLAPRLLWLKRRRPALARRVRTVIGLKDELVRRLTGVVQTDVAHLDYSLLYNVRACRLDEDILAELGLSPHLLPPPRLATEVAGALTPAGASALGLPAGLPVICGSSDGTTAMYGGGVLHPGAAVLACGTTDVLMTAARGPVADDSRTLTLNSGMLPGLLLAGGAMGLAGGGLAHLERLLSVSVRGLSRQIARLPPGAGGLLALPGLTGERSPYWREQLTGAVVGLTLDHGPAQVLRAAMEAAAFRAARLLACLRRCGLSPARIHVTGGYAALGIWNRIRADATGLEVARPRVAEATALGTAMFCRAALEGGGALADISRRWVRLGRRHRPEPARNEAYRRQAVLFEEFIEANADFFRRLSAPPPARPAARGQGAGGGR
jgi:xylulokinase